MVRDAMVVPFESVCLWLIEGADIVRTFDVCLQLICFCFFFLLYIFFVFQKRQVTLLPWQWIIMTVWVVTIKVNAAMGMDDFDNFRQRTKLNSIFFVFLLQSKKKNVWVQLEWPRPTDVSMWHRNKICPCAKNVIVIRPLFLSQVSIYGAYMVFQLEPVNRVHLLSSFIDIN